MLRKIAKEMANKEHRRILNETALYFDELADLLDRDARTRLAT